MSEAMLVADRLTRHFGGLKAVNGVDFALEDGSGRAWVRVFARVSPSSGGPDASLWSDSVVLRVSDGPADDGTMFYSSPKRPSRSRCGSSSPGAARRARRAPPRTRAGRWRS